MANHQTTRKVMLERRRKAFPPEDWNTLLDPNRARNFYGVLSHFGGVFPAWYLAKLAGVNPLNPHYWEVTGFEIFEEGYAYSIGYSKVDMDSNAVILTARAEFQAGIYRKPTSYFIPVGIPVLENGIPPVPVDKILDWHTPPPSAPHPTPYSKRHAAIPRTPHATHAHDQRATTLPGSQTSRAVDTEPVTPTPPARFTSARRPQTQLHAAHTNAASDHGSGPSTHPNCVDVFNASMEALNLGPSAAPSKTSGGSSRHGIGGTTSKTNPFRCRDRSNKPDQNDRDLASQSLSIAPSISSLSTQDISGIDSGRGATHGITFNHHMRQFLKLYHQMNSLQIRLIHQQLSRIPTNPAGILSASGARYAMDDIREYGMQPLLLCGLNHRQARYFIDWVLDFDLDSDEDEIDTPENSDEV